MTNKNSKLINFRSVQSLLQEAHEGDHVLDISILSKFAPLIQADTKIAIISILCPNTHPAVFSS